jgi:hypothetical protein
MTIIRSRTSIGIQSVDERTVAAPASTYGTANYSGYKFSVWRSTLHRCLNVSLTSLDALQQPPRLPY